MVQAPPVSSSSADPAGASSSPPFSFASDPLGRRGVFVGVVRLLASFAWVALPPAHAARLAERRVVAALLFPGLPPPHHHQSAAAPSPLRFLSLHLRPCLNMDLNTIIEP
ncbi:hypothetical protein U9M48_025526 [Paspalum notatum var. saurae]|uniref:Uncharacterized protein n=1 Tax=Paspalum notatum var. saurae TaxID=547442 RepID=A0AAQ3TQL5_PASNO